MKKFFCTALILSVFLLSACQLFALAAARKAPPPEGKQFALQDGKLVEWHSGAYHPLPMDGLDSESVILAVENDIPVLKMRMQWEKQAANQSIIFESDDLTVGQYRHGAWEVLPFQFTVVPESIHTAQEQYAALSDKRKDLMRKQSDNSEDHFYYLTFSSTFPVGMKFDAEKRQMVILLTNQDGFTLVRPQVITPALVHPDSKQINDRTAIQNDGLTLAGVVAILEKVQYTRMTYPPDAQVRNFFYTVDITAKGPKSSVDYFGKSLSALYINDDYYARHIGSFSTTFFQRLVEGSDPGYTVESLVDQWKWFDSAGILAGENPWAKSELVIPGVSIELFFNNTREN
jgi:hypothetical protein